MKVVPRPGRLATAMVPPCSLTSSCTSARPMPEPSWVRARAPSIAVEALEDARQLALGNADAGVRHGRARRARPRRAARRAMRPSNVNLNAFDSRLRTIFSHISRSTNTGSGSGGQSTSNRRPPRSIAERKVLARSAVSAARSVGS